MQWILDAMRKRLSQQYRGKNMIGTVAVSCIKEFFNIEKKSERIVRESEVIEGYVRNSKLFIKTTDQEIKIQLFRQKNKLLSNINEKLESLWYKQKIENIYLK